MRNEELGILVIPLNQLTPKLEFPHLALFGLPPLIRGGLTLCFPHVRPLAHLLKGGGPEGAVRPSGARNRTTEPTGETRGDFWQAERKG